MASGVDIGQLKKSLECSICLEQYEDPKLLSCSHHFCKECLEDLLTFKGDGSAVIVCPLRCEVETIISKNQTVTDLVPSYVVKNVVEAFKTGNKTSDILVTKCKYSEVCEKQVAVYCCRILMCKQCHSKHKTKGHLHITHKQRRNVNLIFSRRESQFKVFCVEHVSPCTHLCKDDNKFLCRYCMHRDQNHKSHNKNTVETKVKLLKEALSNELDKRERFLQFRSITEQSIITGKEKFDELLKVRKQKLLVEDWKNTEGESILIDIDKEEEMVKKKFETICEEHMHQYHVDSSSNYYQAMLKRSDVTLVLQEEEILNTICTNQIKQILNIEIISLSSTTASPSSHPLGDFNVHMDGEVWVNFLPVPTLDYVGKEIESEITSTRDYIARTVQGLRSLQRTVKSGGKHRNRRKKEKSVRAEVKLLREALDNELSKTNYIFGFQCNITEQNILIAKEKFDELLKLRKQILLMAKESILVDIDKEEEMLKMKFKTICGMHMHQYDEVSFFSYYQAMSERSDVELVLQREEILNTICENEIKRTSLNTEIITLLCSFSTLHPLGDFTVLPVHMKKNALAPCTLHFSRVAVEVEIERAKYCIAKKGWCFHVFLGILFCIVAYVYSIY